MVFFAKEKTNNVKQQSEFYGKKGYLNLMFMELNFHQKQLNILFFSD